MQSRTHARQGPVREDRGPITRAVAPLEPTNARRREGVCEGRGELNADGAIPRLHLRLGDSMKETALRGESNRDQLAGSHECV